MRGLRALFLPLSLVLLLAAAAIVPLPVFLEMPGRPVSLADGVQVDAPDSVELDGDFLLMSVRLPRGTVLGVVRALVDRRVSLVTPERVLPPGVSDREYFDTQRHVFQVSADLAAAVGLRAAGLIDGPIELTGEGVEVRNVVAGAPADGLLEPGDVVVAANGQEVRTDLELRAMVPVAGSPGPLALEVRRNGEQRTVEVQPRVMDIGDGERRPVIGIELQTHRPRVDLPVPVEIDTGPIGGPSAGLMIALTVYDKVSPDLDLAAGRVVAGTGGLDQDGSVRPIGGISQKVIAAADAGAELFLVPRLQLDQARDALPPGSALEVRAVGTFDDAVEVLLGAVTAVRPPAARPRAA
jgi:Lon-like protease